MISNIIMAATTSANTADFYVPQGKTATLIANGIAGAEYVNILIRCGETYVTCYDFDSETALQLTPTKNPIQLQGPAYYRASKSATAAATALGLEI